MDRELPAGMEGRIVLTCADCGRTREIAGEMPEEYAACFGRYVDGEGWVPKPGPEPAFLCGVCARRYAGHETIDDEEKVLGERDPRSL